MELTINSFSRIKNTTIVLDGITVIAGENNTGKSGVGKVLYSLLSSFSSLDKKNKSEIEESLVLELLRLRRDANIEIYEIQQLIPRLLTLDGKNLNDIEKILGSLKLGSYKERWAYVISNILNYDKEDMETLLVKKIFEQEFNNQCPSLIDLCLRIEEKCLGLKISKDFYSLEKSFQFNHNCILIDDPNILDSIGIPNLLGDHHLITHTECLYDLLSCFTKCKNIDQRVQPFLDKIQSIIHGDLIYKNLKPMFHDECHDHDVELKNLSKGIKSFAILLKLLEDGEITNQSVVILENPEAYLHPNWQIEYARLLVLLQKVLDLNILVTTHSPYFVNAIEVFSQKYRIVSKCNYYLSYLQDGLARFKLVNDNLDYLYKTLAEPLNLLQTIEEELNL